MRVDNKSCLDMGLLYRWGDEKLIKRHQKRYVRYFKNAPGVVLEIGCGRGVMLSLMTDAGIESYGVDSSGGAVELCRNKDLHAIHDDAVKHMRSLSSTSLGGMFCGHVIEHMEPKYAIEFIEESHRILRPGANLVVITPNPKDLRTTERFWLDITHVRPYPEKLLVALLEREGFTSIKIMRDKEPNKNLFQTMAKLIARMWFLGFVFTGDLVVIAKR